MLKQAIIWFLDTNSVQLSKVLKKLTKPGKVAVSWVVLLAAFVVTQSASADEGKDGYQLERLVVTASGNEQSSLDAPGSIEVISASEMRDLNALTVAEALETAVGLNVVTAPGRVEVPSIRGTFDKQTLVLLDGRRLALGFNDSVDLRQIPTVMVERIEVLRGPSSALYGSDAIGGVINIITKKPPRQREGMVRGQYGINRSGEAESFIGSGVVGSPLTDRLSMIFSAEIRKEDGWDEAGELPDDGLGQEPRFTAVRATYDLTDRQSVSSGFEYMENRFTQDRLFKKILSERIQDEERLGYFFEYNAELHDNDQLFLRFNRSEYDYQVGFKPFAAPQDKDGENLTTQIEARYRRNFNNQLVTLGVEHRRNKLEERLNRTFSSGENETSSIFLQDEIQLSSALYGLVGLRYDDNSDFGGQLSPRASLIYSLDANTNLKASVSRGFRAPTLSELNATLLKKGGRRRFEPNPDLEPEDSTSFEVGIKSDYGSFRGGLTGFYNQIDDLIAPVLEGGSDTNQDPSIFRYQNISEATLQGFEAEGSFQLPKGFALAGNFTYVDTDVEEGVGSDGVNVGEKPDYKAFLKLSFSEPSRRLRANLRMSYFGDFTFLNGDRFSYPIFGAFFSKGLSDSSEVFVGVDNIFNKTIENLGVVQIEPTNFYTGVNFKF